MTIISSDKEVTGGGLAFTSFYQPLIVKQGVYLVSNDSGDAVNFSSQFYDNILQNFGYILGDSAATFHSSGNAIYNMDTGVMTSYQTAIYDFVGGNTIDNSGKIEGAAGIYSSGEDEHVINAGIIDGVYNALILSGAYNAVDNSGVITGTRTSLSMSGSTASVALRNTGTLDGDVVLGDGGNSIINRGIIVGNVGLGGGTDTFSGQGGTVSGVIDGGAGADRILAGNDGETLAGGAGHDRLVGGTGADIFAFSSFSAADSDVIKGFNVANDTIQFDHTIFSHLIVDAVPTFTIGTKATSATDFLFYNSGTGNLYYDVDGSKTAHPSYLIANLGPGLHVTANNVSVV